MRTQDFAEQILFGTRLEDKLLSTENLEDHPVPWAGKAPRYPGRPDGLRLDIERERVPFPGVHELDRPGMRGRVLHFFANHELLAIEVMALALLRFHDAPAAFRKGLVQTIAEEQEHLRLYADRMKADGVAFGEIPVSAFFWNALSSMESPMTFVAGMSLTFEQANLDYAGYYAQAFSKAGDAPTAKVLHQVYEDEIGHVKHGEAWFQRWRSPLQSAFEAYAEALPDLLTPARAKGLVFDLGARQRAGLSEDYIRALEVFSDSRGRPPNLWWLHLGCEHDWVWGAGQPTPRTVTQMQEDLEALPLFLAASDDAVLISQPPDVSWLHTLREAGVQPPRFIEVPSGAQLADVLPYRHLTTLQPWGWSSAAVNLLDPVSDRCVHPEPEPLLSRSTRAAAVNRKSFSLHLAHALADRRHDPRLIPRALLGQAHTRPEDAWEAVRELSRSHSTIVCKADWGASGRGQVRWQEGEDDRPVRQWLEQTLRHQPAVVVEPWLNRRADLSMVGRLSPDGTFLLDGMTRFLSDRRGQYRGAIVGRPWFGLDPSITRFLHGDGQDRAFSRRELEAAALSSAAALHQEGYQGPMGIDALVYDTPEGLRLRPIVEINARWTMGHVARRLASLLAGGSQGLWLTLRVSDVHAPSTFAADLRAALPLVTNDARSKRLRSGALFLNDPERARTVFSVLLVAKRPEPLLDALRPLVKPGVFGWLVPWLAGQGTLDAVPPQS